MKEIITGEDEGKNGMMTLWREKEDDTNGFWIRCIQPLQKNTWIKHCPGARQQDRLWCVTLNSPGRNIDSHLVPPPNRFTNEAGKDRRVMTPRRELSTCHMETAATAKTHYLLCAHSVFFFPCACPFYTGPVCRNQILCQWNPSDSKIRPDECKVFGWLCWYERKLCSATATVTHIWM